MRATYQELKELIRAHAPEQVFFTPGKPIRKDDGKKIQTYQRWFGVLPSQTISIEITGYPKNIVWVQFMAFGQGPVYLAPVLKLAKGVIVGLYPDWSNEKWLAEAVTQIDEGRGSIMNQVKVDRMAMGDEAAVFISVK